MLVIYILNVMNSILFWKELSLVMKNGLFTIMSFENDHDPSAMDHHKQYQKLNHIKKTLCCMFDGIGKVWYFLSYFQGTKRLIRMSWVTRQKLLRLGWEVMLHPPYSSDLAPSDYYLFRSMQYSLNGKTFNDDEAVKSHLVKFFAHKEQKFYERGIMKLPE